MTEKLNDLNEKQKVKQAELDDLEAKSREMQRKLDAASKLITGAGLRAETLLQELSKETDGQPARGQRATG